MSRARAVVVRTSGCQQRRGVISAEVSEHELSLAASVSSIIRQRSSYAARLVCAIASRRERAGGERATSRDDGDWTLADSRPLTVNSIADYVR